jgi:MFS family permease
MKSRLAMRDYYLLEFLNSIAATVFLFCLYFWTRERLAYPDTLNLLLGAWSSLLYVPGALAGGRLGDRIGYDRLLKICFLGMALVLGGLPWLPGCAMPFLAVAGYILFCAMTWPCLEASIVHMPGRLSVVQRIGWYNLTWAAGTLLAYFVSGFLYRWQPASIFWLPALLCLVAWRWLFRPVRPATAAAPPPAPTPPAPVPPLAVRRVFMHRAWLANAVANGFFATFMALTPRLAALLRLSPTQTIWLVCALFAARWLAFVVFRAWEGWHYRSGLLTVALWAMPVLFLAFFAAPHPLLLVPLLLLFGLAIGLAYFSSLYYSMAYGEQKGEHGGRHEAILGLGALLGPLLAAAGAGMFDHTAGAVGVAVGLGGLVALADHLLHRRLD